MKEKFYKDQYRESFKIRKYPGTFNKLRMKYVNKIVYQVPATGMIG